MPTTNPDASGADQPAAEHADQAKAKLTYDRHLDRYQALAGRCARIYRDQPGTAWAALATALTEDLTSRGVKADFAVGLLASLLLRHEHDADGAA